MDTTTTLTSAEKITEFLEKNPKSTQKAIEKGTGLNKNVAFSAVQDLLKEGKIAEITSGKNKMFSMPGAEAPNTNTSTNNPVVSAPKKPAKKVETEKTTKVAKKKTANKPVKKVPKKALQKKSTSNSKRTADNFNRSFSRLRFDGNDYPKGRVVLAVIKKHVEKNPKITSVQLKNVFPDELLKNWGILREVPQAKRASVNGKKRYFFDKEDVITLKDGKTFAVANQFSTENIKPFLKHAKSLGYNITAGKK